MIAGLMIAGPIMLLTAPWDYQLHKIAIIATVFVWIVGIMILYDELLLLLRKR